MTVLKNKMRLLPKCLLSPLKIGRKKGYPCPYVKKILFLAPQPFFQERGTPIAVRMAVETLGQSGSYDVTLLTYHEGFDVTLPGVTHLRMWAPRWLYGIRPGISIKKLIADLFFFIASLRLLAFGRFDFIHAVEESVYIALPFSVIRKIPLVYDMDSSIPEQLTESWWLLRPLRALFSTLERCAIKYSVGVLAICEALKNIALQAGGTNISLLYDVSLLNEQQETTKEVLRDTIHKDAATPVVLYIGNLEGYQGITLLIESFQKLLTKEKATASKVTTPHLVILGGSERHIEYYTNLARKLGIETHVSLLGPRPVTMLGSYLQQASLLVSPRTKGNNTPMKIYSYIDTGIPMVATNLPTHTQVVTTREAFLAEPDAEHFAEELFAALHNPVDATARAAAAQALVEQRYNRKIFTKTLIGFYHSLEAQQPEPIHPTDAATL
jgi:glycosyltransferase involved in cell wall biosynthesis